MAGVAHVFVAISAVIPSLIPFILLKNNTLLAIRLSNLISFVMLFITGYRWGKYTRVNPLRTGLIIVSIAILLALFAIPLGG
jgi:VIT1/CCC1 family predicted Fe2+/Mn2+ transporter